MANYYVDSAAASGGNGSIGTPWNALASITGLAAGDTVSLKCGSVFRETLTPATSGTSPSRITYNSYGTGLPPVIKGSNIVSSWSSSATGSGAYAGAYWSSTVAATPLLVFYNGSWLPRGTDATHLNNLEWFASGTTLTVRDDSGTGGPASQVEACVRSYCVNINSRNFISFSGVTFSHDNSAAINLQGGSISFSSCNWLDCYTWINGQSLGTPLTLSSCTFDAAYSASGSSAVVTAPSQVLTASHCLFRRSRAAVAALRVQASSVAVAIDNCDFVGNLGFGFYNSSTGTLNVRSSVFVGNLGIQLNSTSGTLNLSNSIAHRTATGGRTYISGATFGSGNLGQQAAPKFASPAGLGILSFTFDDTNHVAARRAGQALRSALGSDSGTTCWVKTGLNGQAVSGATLTSLQALVDAGDECGSHSRNHGDLSATAAITGFQYTGAGSACAVSFNGSTLTTSATGAPADNLSISISAGSTTLAEIVSIMTGTGKYTATANSILASGVYPASYLANISGVDCKTSAITLSQDTTKVYAGEIAGSKADLESNLTAPGGGVYNCYAIAYPGGGTTPACNLACVSAGYVAGCIAGYSGGFQQWSNLQAFYTARIAGNAQANVLFYQDYELNGSLGADGGGSPPQTFTVTNVTQGTATGVRMNSYCAVFNGTTAYLSKASISSLDYTGGDWMIAGYATPSALTTERTLFFHGTDASNYHRAWIASDGAGHYEVQSSGSQVVHAYTAAGRFSTSGSTSWCVRHMLGKIQFLWGSGGYLYADTADSNATYTGAVTPANYSGTFYLGAGYNFGSTSAEKFYAGRMDDVVMCNGLAANIYAQAESSCAAGALIVWMLHQDAWTGDIYKAIGDALAVHPLWTSGKLKVWPAGRAANHIKTQGGQSSDGLYLRWNPTDEANYRPASGSPLINAGHDGLTIGAMPSAVSSVVPSPSHIHTWFNEPIAVRSGGATYYGIYADGGSPAVGRYDHSKQIYEVGNPRGASTATIQLDDHNNPAVLRLNNGKILAAYSEHPGKCWASLSPSVDSVTGTWAETQLYDGSTYHNSYAHLCQTTDDQNTIFWFFREGVNVGTAMPISFRINQNGGDGGSWTANASTVKLVANGTQRPYYRIACSGRRIDILYTDGHPDAISTNSLYHVYLILNQAGTQFSLYLADGTLIDTFAITGGTGTVNSTSLPIDQTAGTKIYNGSPSKCWVWDVQWVNGTLYCCYPVFSTTTNTDDTHKYRLATYGGTSWTHEDICYAGDSLSPSTVGRVPHWIYPDSATTGEKQYSPGICLDPNTADRVYLGKKYGDGDVRIQQWDKSAGVWSKTTDLTGASGNGKVNARPFPVLGSSPPNIVWFTASSYTTYTSYATTVPGILVAPTLAKSYKQSPMIWTPSKAPSGIKALYMLGEGSGTSIADLTGTYNGTISGGSLTWNQDEYGSSLSGFTSAIAVVADALAGSGFFDTSVFPKWIVVLYKSLAATTGQYLVAFGNSADTDPIFGITVNNSTDSQAGGNYRDAAGTQNQVSVTKPRDTSYHTLMCVAESASVFRVFSDGKILGSATNTTSTVAFDRFTIGALRRTSQGSPASGAVISAVALGSGSTPSPIHMHCDFASGQFLGTWAMPASSGSAAPIIILTGGRAA